MKIILINPPYFGIDDDRVEQNLGIAYIASLLQSNGFPDTALLELTGSQTLEQCLSRIPYADAYGISCYTTSYKNTIHILSHIRSVINPQAYTFLGGPHPTAMPESTLTETGADLVITGEGEKAVLQAMEHLQNGTPLTGVLKGIITHNLDKLPFPVRLIDRDHPFSRTFHNKQSLSLIATRGCPHSCLHCNSNIMGAGSKDVRARSVDNIISEIQYLKKLGTDSFRFNDDNFLAHPDAHALLKALAGEAIHFRIFSHIEYLTADTCKLLSNAGCDFVSVGIESLNQDNLRFLGKLSNLASIHNLEYARDVGLIIRGSFMVGLPFDTDDTIETAFEEASYLYMQEFAVYPLIPYPGTGIAMYSHKLHYQIVNKDFDTYLQMGKEGAACYSLAYDNPQNGNHFTPADVRRWKIRAEELLGRHMIHMRDSRVAK